MNLSPLARRFALVAFLSAQAFAQPPQPDNVALLVNRGTGRVVGPVLPAAFASANNLASSSAVVTSFSAGGLAGLFTTTVATPASTPALSFTLTAAAANYVWAGPVSGIAAAPGYRLLVPADLPQIPLNKLATDPLARENHTGAQAISTVTGLQAALDAKAATGTTVGMSLLNLANPSAISFLRVNADNSSTALQAAPFKTALGLAAVASSGSAADLTGVFAGNAATATALQTARTINGVAFDGTTDISVPAGAVSAGTLTGNTLAPGVTISSLQSAAGGTFGSAAYTDASAYALAGTSGGTVTSVSIATANGVSGTVAFPTTNATITLALGAIAPSSVNGVAVSGSSTPSLAITGTTAVSGVNTGDQSSVTGNAGTATSLQTARTINGVSFNGGANITVPAAAGTLTGNTLAAGVTGSSLTGAAGGTFGTAAYTNTGAYVAAGTTTAGVPDSLNKRYVTDAGLAVLGNTSGTNTGDQTTISGNAGSATVLQTARAINGVAFNGSAAITVPAAGSTLTDTVPTTKGGTGLPTIGTSLQILRTNAAGTALEYVAPPAAQTTITGNAGSATVLQTPRAINGVNFDGSAAITVPAAAGTLTGATLAAVVTGSSLTGAAGGTFGTAAFQPSTAFLSAAGNAASASILATARTINGVSFNGSANINIPAGTTGTDLTLSGFLSVTNAVNIAYPQNRMGDSAGFGYWQLGQSPTALNNWLIGSEANRFVIYNGIIGGPVNVVGAFNGSTASTSTTTGALTLTGGLGLTGAINAGGAISTLTLKANGAAGTGRAHAWYTNGLERWSLWASGDPESGGDVGTNLNLTSGTDAGAGKDFIFQIIRGTAQTNYLQTAPSSSPTTGAVTFAGGVGVAGSVNAGANVVAKQFQQATLGTITYGSTSTINMSAEGTQVLYLAGATTLATSNRAAMQNVKVLIIADGLLRALTPPAWVWVGAIPTNIAAGKVAWLSLFSTGTTEAQIIAEWKVQL